MAELIPQDLGARIVEAARLAVALHLSSTFTGGTDFRQRVSIGGAGPDFVTEETALPAPIAPWAASSAEGAAE